MHPRGVSMATSIFGVIAGENVKTRRETSFFLSLMAHVEGKITKPFGKKELTFEVPTVQCTVYVHYVHC